MKKLKIAYIAAGAAGMYCGNCLHDNTLARALRRQGQDVLLVPTYTPIKTDEEDVSLHRVFFGGINVYLQQKLSIFRHTPWFLDRLLDSPALIDSMTRMSMSVNPEDLGDLTVSMLQGDEGKQAKEVEKLAYWLKNEVQPDIIHLSNVLLVGLARRLQEQVGVPIVSTVSGEDMFLDGLHEPFRSQAAQILQDRAKDVQRFVSLNQYFANIMAQRMNISVDRIEVVPHGLDLEGHAKRQPNTSGEFTIGYLARIAPEKGLHLLLEAFKLLSAESGLPPLKLKAAGYLGKANRHYLEEIQQHAKEWGLAGRFEYLGEVDRATKIEFVQSLDCLVMPTIYPESKGLPVLEAWANAVPVVVPRHGTFPELLEDVAGGVMCEENDPRSMADQIKHLALNPTLAQQLGDTGFEAVRHRYHADHMALNTLALYHKVLDMELPAATLTAPGVR